MPYMPIMLAADAFSAPAIPQASDFDGLLTALNITPTNVLGVLAAGAGASLALCFAWWGARKLSKMFMSAFKKGKLRL